MKDDVGLVAVGVMIGMVSMGVVFLLAQPLGEFSFEAALSPKGSMVCTANDLADLRGPIGRGYRVVEFEGSPDQRCAVVRIAPISMEAAP